MKSDIAIIAVVAAVTFLTRLGPFVVFGMSKRPSSWVRYLGAVLPPAVMAILVIYCFKSIELGRPESFVPGLIAAAVTAALHIWKGNNLLSIGVGTVLYMVLVQMVF